MKERLKGENWTNEQFFEEREMKEEKERRKTDLFVAIGVLQVKSCKSWNNGTNKKKRKRKIKLKINAK